MNLVYGIAEIVSASEIVGMSMADDRCTVTLAFCYHFSPIQSDELVGEACINKNGFNNCVVLHKVSLPDLISMMIRRK